MPRRPPKKPDPALDLSTHLLALADLPASLDPAALFPHPAPVELEVGSGKGLFLSTAAAARPDRNFLGAEIAGGYARLCAGKLARMQATNARIIHGDATHLVRAMLPDACLAGVHVYFPDPWWKARHRKRRVLSETFLQHAGRVLPAGGELHVWTDVEEYFNESMDLARATGLFGAPVEESPSAAEHGPPASSALPSRSRRAPRSTISTTAPTSSAVPASRARRSGGPCSCATTAPHRAG